MSHKDGKKSPSYNHKSAADGKYGVTVAVGTRNDGVVVYLFMGVNCDTCQLKKKYTKVKSRQIGIGSRISYRLKMRRKLETDRGLAIYSKRQGIIEPPHGHDQKNLGWRQQHFRGMENASLEFMLIRIDSNLGKIARYGAKKMK